MKVYIVIEDDRGYGTSVISVHRSKEIALAEAESSSHYWVEEMELEE